MPWTAPANAMTPGKRTAAGSKERAPSALLKALSNAQGTRRPIGIQRETKDPRTRNTGYGGLSSSSFSQAFFLSFLLSLKPTQKCAQPPGTHPNEPAHDKHAQRPP